MSILVGAGIAPSAPPSPCSFLLSPPSSTFSSTDIAVAVATAVAVAVAVDVAVVGASLSRVLGWHREGFLRGENTMVDAHRARLSDAPKKMTNLHLLHLMKSAYFLLLFLLCATNNCEFGCCFFSLLFHAVVLNLSCFPPRPRPTSAPTPVRDLVTLKAFPPTTTVNLVFSIQCIGAFGASPSSMLPIIC